MCLFSYPSLIYPSFIYLFILYLFTLYLFIYLSILIYASFMYVDASRVVGVSSQTHHHRLGQITLISHEGVDQLSRITQGEIGDRIEGKRQGERERMTVC